MRLIAGEARGRRLQVPRGLQVRPSGARFRESAFGILEHRGAIVGARVLDLYAGSGVLGLEALSRGAVGVVAVERDQGVARILRQNAEHCGYGDRVDVRAATVAGELRRLGAENRHFDLVFVDPPYRSGLVAGVAGELQRLDLLAPGAWILVEHAKEEDVLAPDGCGVETERRFGGSRLTLLQRAGAAR